MAAVMASATEAPNPLVDYLHDFSRELSNQLPQGKFRDHEQVLIAVDETVRMLDGVRSQYLADATESGLVRRSGARHSAGWIENVTGTSRRDANAQVDVAEAVAKTPSLGAALLDGSLNTAQVSLINRTAEASAAEPEQIQGLIDEAKGKSMKHTQRLALDMEREIAHHTPDERYQQQRRKRTLSLRPTTDGSGMYQMFGLFDPLTGERLRTMLIKQSKLMHEGKDEPREPRQIMADALEELMDPGSLKSAHSGSASSSEISPIGPNGKPGERPLFTSSAALRQSDTASERPTSSGTKTSRASGSNERSTRTAGSGVDVIVTVTLQDLIHGLDKTGRIVGSAESLPVSEIRRLAAKHGIIPAVLGSNGEVLDLGRESRLASPAQKKALKITYQGCGVPECDASFEYCQIHHIWEWIDLGPTDLIELVPLCTAHHHLVHDEKWTITKHPDHSITIQPP